MAETPDKVVWVLGSGFSAALGGPMLTGLLGDASAGQVRVRYPKEDFPRLHTDAAAVVRRLFRYGLGDTPTRTPAIWRDAEEFLDYIDTAAEASPARASNPHAAHLKQELLPHVLGTQEAPKPDELRAEPRRIIAAECSGFLKNADVSKEQWAPFRRWLRLLTPSDTVITFNYDRVVERLHEHHNKERARVLGPLSQVKVLLPGDLEDASAWQGCTPLLKLHGSVDWRKPQKDEQRQGIAVGDEHYALSCKDEELAIATPGPSKQREGTIGFSDLWKLAKEALKDADAVVFVGYRFPETDADARAALLGAIGDNPGKGSRSTLTIHAVLGNSDQSTRDTGRLFSMLRFVLGRHRFEVTRRVSGRSGCERARGSASPWSTRGPFWDVQLRWNVGQFGVATIPSVAP